MTYALRSVALGPRDTWSHNTLGIAINQYSAVLAIAALRESARLDPLYLYPPLNEAEALASMGRAGEALQPVEGVLRLEPDMPWAIALKASIFIDLGRTQKAEVVAKQVNALLAQGRLHSEYRYILDGLNLDSGASLHELAMWARNPNPMVEYLGVHKWLMQHGHAQDVIEILDRRTRKGAIPYDYLRLAPWLASLQNDPRFQSVLKRARGQFEEMLSVLDEARARGEFPQYLETPLAEMRRQLQ